MKILVDARPLITVGNGNARYLSGMLDAATARRPDWQWLLVSHRALNPAYATLFSRANVDVLVDRSPIPAFRAGPIWLHLRVPSLLNSLNPDLYWSTLGLLPFAFRGRCHVPAILNVHDMNPFVAADTMRGWVRVYLRQFMRRSIRDADRVLCLSETTLRDIVTHVPGIDRRRLVVQYPGMIPPPESHLRRRPETLAPDVREFVLAVGTLEPRKNLDTLVHAYLQARTENPYLRPLVVAGHPGWNMSHTLQRVVAGELKASGIHYAGAPSDAQLAWLYENATALFFPSLHEGFGLPALEAAWFDRPIYLSDIPIFREILPSAIFTPPLDVHAWAERLLSLHRKAGVRPKLKRKEWTYEFRSIQLCRELETAASHH